jgi:hypothetical protein
MILSFKVANHPAIVRRVATVVEGVAYFEGYRDGCCFASSELVGHVRVTNGAEAREHGKLVAQINYNGTISEA